MRNPVATPVSVIVGILVPGFAYFVFVSYITASSTDIISPFLVEYIWGSAFVTFVTHWAALQCAGALITYSLFLGPPVFRQKVPALKSFSSIILSLLILTLFYVVCSEAILPGINQSLEDKRALSTFSNSFYDKALEMEKKGDLVTAAEYMRLSLTVDGNNSVKISKNSDLISALSPEEFQELHRRTTTESDNESFNTTTFVSMAQAELDKKNYIDAFFYANEALTIDNTNQEALRISSIAREKDFAGISAKEKTRAEYLFKKKKEGYEALSNTDHPDYIKAYFIFMALSRQYPFDHSIQEYLREARKMLPTAAFFTDEADVILGFNALSSGPIVFFNIDTPDRKEIVSIESRVQIGDGIFFKNIEVIGFSTGNNILYHYAAPFGKKVDKFILLNGIDKTNPEKRTKLQIFKGTPPIDNQNGISLFPEQDQETSVFKPATLDEFALTKKDFNSKNIADLFILLPAVSRYAQMNELIEVEMITRICTPFIILILSIFCLVIGMKHSISQDASSARHLYILLPLVPIVMTSIIGFLMYLHRVLVAFTYYALGLITGVIVLAAGHILLLILSMLYFSGKFQPSKKPGL